MISVIIPVYNAEDFLEEAILSVFSQTYTDWELILVDDGSTDHSPVICDDIASDNSKVKVIHKKNGGLSSARNAGLERASGEYITFLDADDMLTPESLHVMLLSSEQAKADIVCGETKKFSHSFSPADMSSSGSGSAIREFNPIKAIEEILYQRSIDNSAWGKLYKANLWKTIRFRENIGYEDLDVFYIVFRGANKIIKIENTVYLYRQHGGSYLHNFTPRRADVLEVTERLTDYMRTYNESLLPAARSRQLSANFNILGLIAANNGRRNDITNRIADECWEKIKELRSESLRNPNVRLKNKIGIIVSYLAGRKGVELLSRIVYRN